MLKQILIISSIFLLTVYGALDESLFDCNGNPDVPFYARNRRGCAWFFTCNPGQPAILGRCPDPYFFNHQLQICDYKENVDCVDSVPVTECPEKGFALIPHPDACSKYVVCFDGQQQDRDCELGLHFSPLDGKCIEPSIAQCSIDAAFCAANQEFAVNNRIRSTRDCNSYYMCSEDNVVPHRCAPDFHFNALTGFCETIENANCDTSTNLPELDFIPEEINNLCIDEVDGSSHFFEDSCDFWYLCAGGRAYIKRCGEGAVFDVNQLRCVARDVADSQCATDTEIELQKSQSINLKSIRQFLENARLNAA